MLFNCGQPDSVIRGVSWFVAKDENDLLVDVNCEAAEHGASPGRERSKRVEDELMGDGLTRLSGEEGVVEGA